MTSVDCRSQTSVSNKGAPFVLHFIMDRLTPEQRLQIIEFYYQKSCSVRNVFRALRPFYGRHKRPTEQAIQAIVKKFRTHSTILDIKPPSRVRRVRTEENIAAVSASVNEDRNLSIRRRSQRLGLCYSTTWKILRKDLGKSNGNQINALEGKRKRALDENQRKADQYPVGSRCKVSVRGNSTRLGTVMYKGEIEGKKGVFIGVKYDEPLARKHGSVDVKRYFECKPNYGGFVIPSAVEVGDFPPEDTESDEEI